MQSRQHVLDAFAVCDPFKELAGALYRETFRLVGDQLGTPRMIADRTGSLVGIKRHDYLPFGEELAAEAGGRMTTQGYYGAADNVRQQFTGYERDDETELDYAEARYYHPNQGRFLSIDPLLSTGAPGDPQTWNRYAYALNNPLYYTDPTGMYVCKGNKDQCAEFAQYLSDAKEDLKKIEATFGKDSTHYKKAEGAVNAYGEDETGKKKNNGVIINFDLKGEGGRTTAFFNSSGQRVGNIIVRFNGANIDPDAVRHEGSHVSDYQKGEPGKFQTEFDAFTLTSVFREVQSPDENFNIPVGINEYPIWSPTWEGPDKENYRREAIKRFLAVPKSEGGYGLTPPRPKTPRGSPQRRKR